MASLLRNLAPRALGRGSVNGGVRRTVAMSSSRSATASAARVNASLPLGLRSGVLSSWLGTSPLRALSSSSSSSSQGKRLSRDPLFIAREDLGDPTIRDEVRAVAEGSDPSSDAMNNRVTMWESTDGHWEHSRAPVRRAGDTARREFHYFVTGSARMIYANMIRLGIVKVLASLSATADVLAMATIEVNLKDLAEGSTMVVKWRGKPVFIRHRTAEEITKARSTPLSELKDPQDDESRAQVPKYLVVIGVCTHLGCVPLANAGEYNGWFCPCHGSHYDLSGRIRRGPAPLNLEVPEYKFTDETMLVLG